MPPLLSLGKKPGPRQDKAGKSGGWSSQSWPPGLLGSYDNWRKWVKANSQSTKGNSSGGSLAIVWVFTQWLRRFSHCTWVSRTQMDPWWMPCPHSEPAHHGPHIFYIRLTRQLCVKSPAWSLLPFPNWALGFWSCGINLKVLSFLLWLMFSYSRSWGNPFSLLLCFSSGLNLDPFWFWPDQVIAHSWGFCTVMIYSEPCLLSGHMGLMVAAISYMILLTLCLQLHL